MSIQEDISALRRFLDELASDADDELLERYELKRPPMPPGLYWRMRWLAGRVLRMLGSLSFWRPEPWPASLKQSGSARAKPVLIWAVGADRDSLRIACDAFARRQHSWRGFAPVLITDVADFAFFSRLGWLVEYVPRLSGEGKPYDERKLKFLARLYRGAPALPIHAAPETDLAAYRLLGATRRKTLDGTSGAPSVGSKRT